ncbi:hypothetical protein PHLGIDRAFT_30226 [Phlebiopsis gigantea 11061_1 CR5-6]|uniref:Uncharacterized protein n=1 Tax=Phlebiopsis gigantea (strain 11061_1 CR5-6) TaxID=745531 RepID=A0A0C3NPD1_PHLG1|nr:hypothetical protein PHLGIDRAFT_30226 [Phlebiopsis gigantea 11061_1 CR5-6]
MLVMSSEWEQRKVPVALAALRENLVRLDILGAESPSPSVESKSLDERKIQHAHFAKGVEPRTPSTITKSISHFLAQNRARNDASNRREFLLSLAEKNQHLSEVDGSETGGTGASCARTDAKTQNRDIQMKYDIAKNEDGPLRKTMKRDHETSTDEATSSSKGKAYDEATADRYPGLDERLRNIETHVAVRYVPSPPRSLLDRLKFLEEHLVRLEKDYPPWAALHFNQPHRGWPPPPRPTPIIVPSHLTATEPSTLPSGSSTQTMTADGGEPGPSKSKGKTTGRNAMSSLQRAVLERLEVQKAMNDLGRVKTEPS